MNVYWSHRAQRHLDDIFQQIALDSPAYAKGTLHRLTRRSQQLTLFPFSGRVVPEYQCDQLREIIEAPYRIIYQVSDDQIRIVAIYHGARLLPPAPPQDPGLENSQ